MGTLLLLLWLRRYLRQHPFSIRAGLLRKIKTFTLLMILVPLLAYQVKDQGQLRQYSIHRNGQQVGTLNFYIRKQPGSVRLQLDSKVKTRMLVSLAIVAKEEALYQQNRMIFSSIRRFVNGSEKENKTITASGDRYRINNMGEERPFAHPPIQYSTLSLYAWEPVQVSQVFSDTHQQMVPIREIGPGHYRINYPDGKYNEFWYRSGQCTRVLMHSPWYRVDVRLEKTSSL